MARVAVANSIGVDERGDFIIHSPSRWSEGVKTRARWFAYYPWELAYCSSLLKRETGHHVRFFDGCLMQRTGEQYFQDLAAFAPEWIVLESASRMIAENLRLLQRLKAACGTRVILVGHHASAFPAQMRAAGVDEVCLGEYEETVLELLQGRPVEGILGRHPNPRRPLLRVDRLPWPEDTDVSRLAYATPGEPSSDYLEIQAYATRGCPKSCAFCVVRHLYYAAPNWRTRPVEDIVSEVAALKAKYPAMEGVFFDEEEHNVSKAFILALTAAIRQRGLATLRYDAMCDIRHFDREMIEAMRAAGYYKVRVGIESASERVQAAINKRLDLDHVLGTLRLLRAGGLKVHGTFMFGAPGSSAAEDLKTVRFIRDAGREGLLDNLQLSICTPQPGTPLYAWAKAQGALRTEDFQRFDGGQFAVIYYPHYRPEQIEEMKRVAFETRDHTFLVRHLRQQTWRTWIRTVRAKYGWWGAVAKAWRRLGREGTYWMRGRAWLKFPLWS